MRRHANDDSLQELDPIVAEHAGRYHALVLEARDGAAELLDGRSGTLGGMTAL
jgi:hypothetical protein